MTTRERLASFDPELMMLEPEYDEAIVGLAERAGGMAAVAYDRSRVIDVLTRQMPREDAEEWFEFNIVQAWVGENTPVFIDTRVAE